MVQVAFAIVVAAVLKEKHENKFGRKQTGFVVYMEGMNEEGKWKGWGTAVWNCGSVHTSPTPCETRRQFSDPQRMMVIERDGT